jgi:hypothetical protein
VGWLTGKLARLRFQHESMATCCENHVGTRLELTPAERGRYDADGIVFPIRVLSPEDAACYKAKCDELEILLGGKPRTVEVRQMHLHFAWAWRLATTPRVLDAVECLLGSDLLVTATELFAKHPEEGVVSVGWHRDGPYMGLDPTRTVTAWIALTGSHLSNGCMQFAREADRRAITALVPRNRSGEIRPSTPPDKDLHEVALDAGEMSLHDVHVLHGSGPNHSPHKRVGFAIRFTTPEGRPSHTHVPAVLARGADRFGYYDLVQPPARDDDPSADIAPVVRSARRRRKEAAGPQRRRSRS